MIGLLQRVDGAAVEVDGREIARIGRGLLVLIGVERGDDEASADRLLERLVNYRVFADVEGRMNLSALDVGGGLLLVPQFTLVADTAKGLRPGFSRAAAPAEAERLFGYMAKRAEKRLPGAQSGRFGAHMRVSLVNDGPVTFSIRVPPHDGPD
jgi:D-tyrosyl-tRNA(Tyr) deacylase